MTTGTKYPWIVVRTGWLLMCQRCGDTYQIGLPASFDMMEANLEAFGKSHKNCKDQKNEPQS
jgi:hypothetical protein